MIGCEELRGIVDVEGEVRDGWMMCVLEGCGGGSGGGGWSLFDRCGMCVVW